MLWVVPCPRCGGQVREPIAPGYWLCRSLVIVNGSRLGPVHGSHPGGGNWGPQPIAWQEPCNTEYHEVAGDQELDHEMPLACSCGTFAIGQCPSCGVAVCGTHSLMRSGQRLCLDCNSRAEAEASRITRKTRESADMTAYEQKLSVVTQAMSQEQDAVARYLIAVLAGPRTYRSPLPQRFPDVPLPPRAARLALRTAETLRSSLGVPKAREYDATGPDAYEWPFDATELMAWVARHPQVGPGTEITLQRARPTSWGGVQTVARITGWLADSASWHAGSFPWHEMYALSDGSFAGIPHGARKLATPSWWPLDRDHLYLVAKLCDIPIPEITPPAPEE
jgi:hypothetical protein